jgi:hypothetical protein
MARGYGDEFPLLADLGLYASEIRGDGMYTPNLELPM